MGSDKTREPITIRSGKADDAEEITRIYIDSWNVGFGGLMPHRIVTSERIERWRQDIARPVPHRWWVAEQKGIIVGLAGIGPSRDPVDAQLGELDTIAVDPPYWCRGIGKALMSVVLRYLAADGYREAILWTLAQYERGQRFYEAMGWRFDGGVRDEGRQIRYRHSLVV